MLTWELLGTILGAGIASGREIASFFAGYGRWSLLGVAIAGGMLLFLANNELPHSWDGDWRGQLWKLLLSVLLIVTGGAMLSGAGEVAALVFPAYGGYWIGTAATCILAWMLAHHTTAGLAWTSRGLLTVLTLVIIIGLRQPSERAAVLPASFFPAGILRASAYGGFNAALLLPVLEQKGVMSPLQRKRAIRNAGLLFVVLVLAGDAVLLRHPVLSREPLPFVYLLKQAGKSGFYLGAASIYLAILSTLTACFRGLGRRWYAPAGIFGVTLWGFNGVVAVAYPLVGTMCLCMLATAKFVNSSRKAFQARGDML